MSRESHSQVHRLQRSACPTGVTSRIFSSNLPAMTYSNRDYPLRTWAAFQKQVILESAYHPSIDDAKSTGWLASAETLFGKGLGVASSTSG